MGGWVGGGGTARVTVDVFAQGFAPVPCSLRARPLLNRMRDDTVHSQIVLDYYCRGPRYLQYTRPYCMYVYTVLYSILLAG